MRASGTLLLLLVFVLAGMPDAFGRRGGKDGDRPNKKCSKSSKGERWEKRHKHAHGRMSHHNRQHGERSRGWGNSGSAACGGGQGSCASSSGGGYRGLASALGAAASDLTGQAQELKNLQEEIVDESVSAEPGPGNPDAQRFAESTNNGKSRRSDFTSASDPIVKEQVEFYNDVGDTIDELEAESKKFQGQENEMNGFAEKSENNASNLESKNGSANGNVAGMGGFGQPQSTIANRAKAVNLTNAENSLQKLGSDISVEPVNEVQAKYPDKRNDLAHTSEGIAPSIEKKKSSLRDSLRERLRDSSSESQSNGSRDSGSASPSFGISTLIETAKNAASKKENRNTADSANAEESISTFKKNLGNGTIAIAGSETEASVEAMLRDFDTSKESSREPASQINAEIGPENGPTLFERCHATHKRCAKNGCVNIAATGKAGG